MIERNLGEFPTIKTEHYKKAGRLYFAPLAFVAANGVVIGGEILGANTFQYLRDANAIAGEVFGSFWSIALTGLALRTRREEEGMMRAKTLGKDIEASFIPNKTDQKLHARALITSIDKSRDHRLRPLIAYYQKTILDLANRRMDLLSNPSELPTYALKLAGVQLAMAQHVEKRGEDVKNSPQLPLYLPMVTDLGGFTFKDIAEGKLPATDYIKAYKRFIRMVDHPDKGSISLNTRIGFVDAVAYLTWLSGLTPAQTNNILNNLSGEDRQFTAKGKIFADTLHDIQRKIFETMIEPSSPDFHQIKNMFVEHPAFAVKSDALYSKYLKYLALAFAGCTGNPQIGTLYKTAWNYLRSGREVKLYKNMIKTIEYIADQHTRGTVQNQKTLTRLLGEPQKQEIDLTALIEKAKALVRIIGSRATLTLERDELPNLRTGTRCTQVLIKQNRKDPNFLGVSIIFGNENPPQILELDLDLATSEFKWSALDEPKDPISLKNKQKSFQALNQILNTATQVADDRRRGITHEPVQTSKPIQRRLNIFRRQPHQYPKTSSTKPPEAPSVEPAPEKEIKFEIPIPKGEEAEKIFRNQTPRVRKMAQDDWEKINENQWEERIRSTGRRDENNHLIFTIAKGVYRTILIEADPEQGRPRRLEIIGFGHRREIYKETFSTQNPHN